MFGEIKQSWPVIRLLGLAGLLYSATHVLIIGDTGFRGDGWEDLSFPFWNSSFKAALLEGAARKGRPGYTLWLNSIYRIFEFNDQFYHFLSLIMLAFASLMMGIVLLNVFPRQRLAIWISVLVAFYFPTLLSQTVNIEFSNGRLSLLWFWLSVFCLQLWTWKQHSMLIRSVFLLLAGGLLSLSHLSYEAALFYLLLIPFLLFPLYTRQHHGSYQLKSLAFTFIPVALIEILSVTIMRFVREYFGLTLKRDLSIPPLKAFWDFFVAHNRYQLMSFEADQFGPEVALIGLVVACCVFGLLWWLSRTQEAVRTSQQIWLLVLGFALMLLGYIPFLAARYPAVVAYYGGGRFYAAAHFGYSLALAVVLAWLAQTRFRIFVLAFIAVWIGWSAAFHTILGEQWHRSLQGSVSIAESLYQQAPSVKPGTILLIINFEYDIPGEFNIPVFQGESGIREWGGLFYEDHSVSAHTLYTRHPDFDPGEGRLAIVSSEGVVARGLWEPVALDSILLFERTGDRLTLLDCLSDNSEVAIEWHDGITKICSNTERIVQNNSMTAIQKLYLSSWVSD